MKDYSNYHIQSTDKFSHDAKKLFELHLSGYEGCTGNIDGVESQFLIQKHVSQANEFKETSKIACLSDIGLTRGSLIETLGIQYIVVSDVNDNGFYKDGEIQKVNNSLKYYINVFGTWELKEIPCIISKGSLNIDASKVIAISADEYVVICPSNLDSRKIDLNIRFILSGKAYEIIGIDNLTVSGLINIRIKQAVIIEDDNLELGIANYYSKQHNYSIKILNGSTVSISQGETLQLNAQVTDNGITLSPIPAISYVSQNASIATVDSNGLVTAVNSGGNVVITAMYEGQSTSISISISALPQHNYTVDIVPSGTLKISQSITATAIFKDNGVEMIDSVISWWVTAEDGISSTNLVSISNVGNTCTLKAGSLTGYFILHVNGYNCQNSIRIKVSGLW